MRLVERHIITNRYDLEQICIKSKELYNQSLYYYRQSIFGKIEYFSEYELSSLFAEYDEPSYRSLPAKTAQQVIKLLFHNIKSWQKARKDYQKNPNKYMSRPGLPKYKKEQFTTIFTNQQIKIKNGLIHFSKNAISPIRTNVENIYQVRVIPKSTCHVVEVVYEKKEINHDHIKESNILSIDMGLNNIVTAIDNVGNYPFIINGGKMKSINQYYNKKNALLQSFIGNRGTSKRIQKLTLKRNNKIEDGLHKISAFILKYCLRHGIGTVIIGKNEHWKTRINIGAKTNQHFVSIPHERLIEKIRYKLKLNGVKLIEQEESYTSKCDHLAGEKIRKHEIYSGKRIKRGLFKSANGKVINADVNGAIGIAIKSQVVGECERFIRSIADTGLGYNPMRHNVA